MKTKIGLLAIAIFITGSMLITTHADESSWIDYSNSPTEIAASVVDKANEKHKIQETKFNKINNKGSHGEYQITNTLERITKNIQPYIQWILYIGLVGATILLIWNGFRLVTNSSIGGGDIKTVKENIKSILIGVLIMSGFLVIIKLVMAIMNLLFNT
ncbi:MAG: hypothetical protein DLD55_02305 [candidate division SR1 bacterium]|nr:MAG: hypothetical protein DLD55_02305 [candidate division SR1 bacterium]